MLDILRAYKPVDAEQQHYTDIFALIENHGDDCYHRTHFNPGHVTGSGLLISADGKRVLMNHHRVLNKWLCFGGHADGDMDIMNVAKREIIEESGIKNIEAVIHGTFDVDVHAIPANPHKQEPAHMHFDIRYLFRVQSAADESFTISHESNELRWCLPDEARQLTLKGGGMERMLDKWQLAL